MIFTVEDILSIKTTRASEHRMLRSFVGMRHRWCGHEIIYCDVSREQLAPCVYRSPVRSYQEKNINLFRFSFGSSHTCTLLMILTGETYFCLPTCSCKHLASCGSELSKEQSQAARIVDLYMRKKQ